MDWCYLGELDAGASGAHITVGVIEVMHHHGPCPWGRLWQLGSKR